MKNTAIIAHIAASTMLKGPFAMDAAQVGDYPDLAQLGIVLDTRHINQMAAAMDANVLQPTIGAATMAVPVQYLQTWLPAWSAPSRRPASLTRLSACRSAASGRTKR
jgi:hypothetical protein